MSDGPTIAVPDERMQRDGEVYMKKILASPMPPMLAERLWAMDGFAKGWGAAKRHDGLALNKDLVHGVLVRFAEDRLTLEQAVNEIGRLQHPPTNVAELTLTVTCPYCGRTPGNPCSKPGGRPLSRDHPSRLNAALSNQSTWTWAK